MVRVCLTVLALFLALPASAQQLSLDIRDGLVTMSANNVPVRQILAEWARVGGTKVVGAERVAGAPLTLSLEGVPEGKALDIVLRGAAGYMAAARAERGTGRSMYDRIMVLATSTPPGGGAAATTAAGNRPAANRFGVPPAVEPADAADTGASDVADVVPDQTQVNPFANAFGQPGVATPFGQPGQANPFGQPVQGNPFGQPVQGNPFGQAIPQQPQPFQPAGGFFQPLPPPQAAPGAAPSGFFGIPGSTTPGVIQQPPQQQPGLPGTRPRPQG